MSWVPKLDVLRNVNTLELSVTAAAGTACARKTTFVPRPRVKARTIAVIRRRSRSHPSARISSGTAVPTSAGIARSVSLALPLVAVARIESAPTVMTPAAASTTAATAATRPVPLAFCCPRLRRGSSQGITLERALEEHAGKVHERQGERVRYDERPPEDLSPHRQLLPEDEHPHDPGERGHCEEHRLEVVGGVVDELELLLPAQVRRAQDRPEVLAHVVGVALGPAHALLDEAPH